MNGIMFWRGNHLVARVKRDPKQYFFHGRYLIDERILPRDQQNGNMAKPCNPNKKTLEASQDTSRVILYV